MRRWRATSAAAAPTCGSVPRSSGREADHMARTLSRRMFLEASAAVGGGLLLGFTLPVRRRVLNDRFAPNAFIRIDRDGRVTLIMHKVEMGQGTYTSMPMLLAEELEVDLNQVQLEHAPADDALYAEPLFGVQETGGSTSVRGNFEPLRRAGAAARTLLVAAAAQAWKVDAAACRAERGEVVHGPTGRKLGYGALVDQAATVPVPHNEGPNARLSTADIVSQLAAASQQPGVVARKEGDVARAMAGAAQKVEAVYEVPFLAHATMEPVNCTVHVRQDGCDVWVGTQVPTFARTAAAKLTGLPRERVQVHNHLLGGGFGRRLEVDFIIRAVQIAMQVAGPVKVIWTREEDIQHDMYRPYYYDRITAGLDQRGRPIAWSHRIAGSSIEARVISQLFP